MPLFDADDYLEKCPDARDKRVDLYAQHLRFGLGEGRDPHPLFLSS
ncbi:hypothetical protein LG047_05295 [Methylocystis sp. WRRC1]|nr:hypothetical protein [Methylocystis sp. WRRC1]MCC3244739.1 hypothetical protein [Methylocystis sp. WRRC1]